LMKTTLIFLDPIGKEDNKENPFLDDSYKT